MGTESVPASTMSSLHLPSMQALRMAGMARDGHMLRHSLVQLVRTLRSSTSFPRLLLSVNPPFTDAYLEHVMCNTLERLVDRFKIVHLTVPVREAPWREKLR